MHHFAWVGAVSNRAYWVVAIWRSQPTEGGKLFRMAARCIISDGEARFPTAPTGLLRSGDRNLQKGENCSGWPRVHHCPWGGAVSNRAYRVGVAIWRAQPTEGENCSGWPQGASFRMGRRGFQPRLPGWCCDGASATYRRGKLFRMAARCIISDGEARFPTAPTGLLRSGDRNLQKGENYLRWGERNLQNGENGMVL